MRRELRLVTTPCIRRLSAVTTVNSSCYGNLGGVTLPSRGDGSTLFGRGIRSSVRWMWDL
ncbi:hypothetical protein GCM10011366_09570 [Ornithinimicrobium tianjinense]|uniref:Uncharacterized protein n=1 Tax=Ornithinimicrobium tianjinense TaxID=1195761 RepID=A0A917BIE0_9MICO|nr:hypothetical protein GCM10011366_09570 [Ornithinimicrobium tianjinense]